MVIEEPESRRILLVEDNPDVGELLKMALADQGFIVRHVLSAEEALSGLVGLSRPDLPHVILFDLRLPGMGGAVLSRTLRERAEWRDIPRVLMTGKSLTPYEEAAMDVSEVFHKPVDITALFTGLHRLADRRSLSTVS